MIYAKRVVPGLNRFYRGHFQDIPNVKTFFGYAAIELTVYYEHNTTKAREYKEQSYRNLQDEIEIEYSEFKVVFYRNNNLRIYAKNHHRM